MFHRRTDHISGIFVYSTKMLPALIETLLYKEAVMSNDHFLISIWTVLCLYTVCSSAHSLLYSTIVAKRQQSLKPKLSIYVPLLTGGGELWVVTETKASLIHAAKITFLHRVSVLRLSDNLRTWALYAFVDVVQLHLASRVSDVGTATAVEGPGYYTDWLPAGQHVVDSEPCFVGKTCHLIPVHTSSSAEFHLWQHSVLFTNQAPFVLTEGPCFYWALCSAVPSQTWWASLQVAPFFKLTKQKLLSSLTIE